MGRWYCCCSALAVIAVACQGGEEDEDEDDEEDEEDEEDDDGPAEEPGEPASLASSFTGARRVSKKLNASSCVCFRFRVEVEIQFVSVKVSSPSFQESGVSFVFLVEFDLGLEIFMCKVEKGDTEEEQLEEGYWYFAWLVWRKDLWDGRVIFFLLCFKLCFKLCFRVCFKVCFLCFSWSKVVFV